MRFLVFIALALALTLPSSAGGWAPIPPEVWAMKEEPARGIQGAVILEDRMCFRNSYIEYLLRIRILSEAGRKAAELDEFPSQAYGFEGRTVYRDGTEVVFNKRKDFQSRVTKVGSNERERTVIFPPGVTSDCVVELRWVESAANKRSPLPARMGSSHEWSLSHRCMTEVLSVEVPLSFPFGFVMMQGRNSKPLVEEKGGRRVFTFRNLPAVDEVPYSLEVTRDIPRFVAFDQPELVRPFAKAGPESYWRQSVNAYWRDLFVEQVGKGKTYRAFSTELRADLPKEPIQLAAELLGRLDARIQNSTYPTYAELGNVTKALAEEESDSSRMDLDDLVKLGKADSFGMTLLFVHLLRDAGVDPKIALVADRDLHLFRWDFLNIFQFDAYLVGVERADGAMAWFEPALRFAPPGMVHPDYQGVPALQFDTKDWSTKRITLAPQSAASNRRSYEVRLELEEELDRFFIEARFKGFPEWSERRRFQSLEPKEQERTLKESLEKDLKGAQISKAEVLGAQDPKSSLSWKAEGVMERESGRKRDVNAFPGIPWALWVPDQWPTERKEAIVIPFLRQQEAVCTFRVPKRFAWADYAPYEHANRFGEVKWTASKQGDDLIQVKLEVKVLTFFAAPEAYGEFREFMGWVSEASGRVLQLAVNR
jgi:hypothetical protein